MDYLEALKARKAQLAKEIEAIDVLLGVSSQIQSNPSKIDEKAYPVQKSANSGEYEFNQERGTVIAKKSITAGARDHEAIREGKRGNCTTVFIEANPKTEFKRAAVRADGTVVE